jgi:1-deoxy-D-xylulose-5-phosphate reductoisomerase
MKQRVIILGSTGSIGRNTLEVIALLADEFDVVGLAAGSNAEVLAEQARQWQPEAVALADSESVCPDDALPRGCRIFAGDTALADLVSSVEADCIVSAVVGAAGLPATLAAVKLGRKVAIANKEPLVMAGAVLMPLARAHGATILPIDSEHSAVFQAMQAGRRADVERIVLTASGGPFWNASADELARATRADALNHPTWDMGPKITIDSATMMNKALEIIEARWLFELPSDRIDVVVHPESIVHSLVEFRDGSVVAQLGTPDMRVPIQYALTYPRRLACPAERLCLHTLGKMTFFAPDNERFPSLRLGHAVARRGGTTGAVLNAANEEANALFRAGAIGFMDMVALTEDVLARHDCVDEPDLAALLAADAWAREEIAHCAARAGSAK